MTARTLPVPLKPTAETLPFWQACADGRLVYQRCMPAAGPSFRRARAARPATRTRLGWRESARIGTVHTHTTVLRAPTAAFKRDVPYVIALVDLDEGFRMMMNVRGADPEAVRIGSPGARGLRAEGRALSAAAGRVARRRCSPSTASSPERVYGRHTETLGEALLERWCALYPWDRPRRARCPRAVATVLTMRAYMLALQPRPPGNVHAGTTMRVLAPLVLGSRVTTEIRCVGKELKRDRRFVDVASRCVDEAGAGSRVATCG